MPKRPARSSLCRFLHDALIFRPPNDSFYDYYLFPEINPEVIIREDIQAAAELDKKEEEKKKKKGEATQNREEWNLKKNLNLLYDTLQLVAAVLPSFFTPYEFQIGDHNLKLSQAILALNCVFLVKLVIHCIMSSRDVQNHKRVF